jgi:hypothetical protein
VKVKPNAEHQSDEAVRKETGSRHRRRETAKLGTAGRKRLQTTCRLNLLDTGLISSRLSIIGIDQVAGSLIRALFSRPQTIVIEQLCQPLESSLSFRGERCAQNSWSKSKLPKLLSRRF